MQVPHKNQVLKCNNYRTNLVYFRVYVGLIAGLKAVQSLRYQMEIRI